MRYKFNFLFQLFYGIVGFATAMLVIYLFTKGINWIASGIIGISEFALSGFYTRFNKQFTAPPLHI